MALTKLQGQLVDSNTTITATIVPVSGNTASRPANPVIGTLYYNTTIGALENYSAQGWSKVNVTVPAITGVSGAVYSGNTSTITFTGINFGLAPATVTFTSGATTATADGTPINGGTSLSVLVPSAIYNLSAASSVTATVTNSDGTVSGSSSVGVVNGMPTGGTITTSGNTRYHTFTSSGILTVPSGFSVSSEYLIVAGGGGGGYDIGGGGGAGGLINGSLTITAQAYSITIGSGGAGSSVPYGTKGSSGANSAFAYITAIGGGGGGSWLNPNGMDGSSGGSGGGGGGGFIGTTANGGAGTLGQGYAGGSTGGNSDGHAIGGGGGGAGAVGASGGATANGGIGLNYSAWSTATSTGASGYYAGGGGGCSNSGNVSGAGGLGGGSSSITTNGMTNTGGGGHGGGGAGSADNGTNGGSGIVIIRYPLPT